MKHSLFTPVKTQRLAQSQRRYFQRGTIHRWDTTQCRRRSNERNFLQLCKNFLSGEALEGVNAEERQRRLAIIRLALFFGVVAVFGRLYFVQTKDHQRWLQLAARQHETSIEIQGARGTVLDAGGRTLVASVETASLGLHPRAIADRDATTKTLAALTKVDEATIREKLDTDKPFVWLAKGLPRTIGAKVSQAGLRGIDVFPEFQRSYPHGNVASSIIGRISNDGHGQSGVELAFEKELIAPSHKLTVRRDARGRFYRAPADDYNLSDIPSRLSELKDMLPDFSLKPTALREVDPQAMFRQEGGEITLSVDVVLQQIVEEEFARGQADAKAKKVFGLLMDADTGEIMALGQAPGFPIVTSNRVKSEDLRNVVLQDSFEPGSTFKPLIASIALDRGVVKMTDLINCEHGHYQVAGHTIRDVHPVDTVPVSEVLVRSSNIGISKIGSKVGFDPLYKSIRAYGFGSPTGVELPGEAKGIVKRYGDWRGIDVVTASFGQGISVTAMQMVRAYAVLANGGFLVQPSILKGGKPDEKRRVLSESVAQQVASAIVGVTESEHGTGKLAAISGVPVSGKTGTAQKPRHDGRGYETDKVLASFVGFVDGTRIGVNRRLVLFVAVDEPGVTPRWGGVVAGPVFRRTIERVLSQLMTENSQTIQTARAVRSDALS